MENKCIDIENDLSKKKKNKSKNIIISLQYYLYISYILFGMKK